LIGTAAWFFQRITGAVLLFGMIIHFWTMHYSGAEQITYEFVLKRISDPYWKTFDLILLASVIWHGLSGIWGISVEYAGSKDSSALLLKFFQAIILLSGLLLTVTGIYIIWATG